MEYYDLEKYEQEEEQYMINLHFQFNDNPIRGDNLDFGFE